MMLFAIFTFELGSLLCGCAKNINMLIAARAIAGIGGAGLFSMVFIVISDIPNYYSLLLFSLILDRCGESEG